MKRQMMKRRESEWRRKEIKRMQMQQATMKKKRFNSANLQAICEALEDEERHCNVMQQDLDVSDIEERKGAPADAKKPNLLAVDGSKGAPFSHQSMRPPPRFASSRNVSEHGAQKKSPKKPKKLGGKGLAEIPEDREGSENDELAMDLPSKPSYFNMFDDAAVDSEEEMVAGENNYIEIDCLPLEG